MEKIITFLIKIKIMKCKIDMKEPISHSSILSFPNPELRNTFFSNFKDLIETAKELI